MGNETTQDAAAAPRPTEAGRDVGAGILAEIASDLTLGDDPARLLQRFLAPLVRVCGAEAGAMRVLSDDGSRFELVAELGLPAPVLATERSVDRDCGVCGQAAAAREVAWTDETTACARRSGKAYFGAGRHRVLAVPLVHRGQVLGLGTLYFGEVADLAPQVRALLKTLGELLGLALHSARLEQANLRAAVLAERQQMAAEVHDSIAQTLVFAKLRLPLLEAAIDADDAVAARRYCGDLRRAVGDAHVELREVLSHFRAPVDPTGLRHALQASKQALQERAAVALTVDDRAPDEHLSMAQEHQVQHIVKEALNNIVRHAGARHAWLTIERRGGDMEIVVDDDGSGLPSGPPLEGEAHFGLGIMRQRAAMLGGAIEFARRREGGTRVRLRFPVQAAGANA
ncbi:MAG: GAF domain-containing protein [Rubrivivax sp.]|nr:GAF domain-containing protein [Rubrivivax sp.]MDH5340811.1 GAF domain-containing protein [Rubrivivax sp.]